MVCGPLDYIVSFLGQVIVIVISRPRSLIIKGRPAHGYTTLLYIYNLPHSRFLEFHVEIGKSG